MTDSTAHASGRLLADVSLWRSFGMLLLVLVLILAAVWLLRRLQRGVSGSQLDLEVVGRLGLAPKQFLSVVRVGKEVWVLGVTPESIRYIGEYQGEGPGGAAAARPAPRFATLLEGSVGRLGRALARRRTSVAEASR